MFRSLCLESYDQGVYSILISYRSRRSATSVQIIFQRLLRASSLSRRISASTTLECLMISSPVVFTAVTVL